MNIWVCINSLGIKSMGYNENKSAKIIWNHEIKIFSFNDPATLG